MGNGKEFFASLIFNCEEKDNSLMNMLLYNSLP
jgi:hypothetical protein